MGKAGGKNPLPVGLRKPNKGGHSEKSTQHKECWYQLMVQGPSGWTGGPKFSIPFVPPCIPADEKK